MAYEDIYQRYNNLYNSQSNSLKQKRDNELTGYKNQQTDITNQYANLANTLRNKLTNTQSQYGNAQKNLVSKYNNMYTGLDQQNLQTKDKNYQDRNTVDAEVNQNLNRIQELMAKNGWTGGGENLQAQLNSNSDRMNGFGQVDKSMNDTLRSIQNNRNTYQGNQTSESNTLTSDLQNAENDINNEITTNDINRVAKLQSILDAINSSNTNYDADSIALRANLDAQAEAEIYQQKQKEEERAYQEKQEALAYNRQLALTASRTSSRSRSGSGGSSGGLTQTELNKQTLAMAEMQERNGTGMQWLNANEAEIKSQPGGADLYKKLLAKIKNTQTDPVIAYNNAKAISARQNGNIQSQY